MHRMLSAEFAEFLQFDPFFQFLLVFVGIVIDPFTFGAFKLYHVILRHIFIVENILLRQLAERFSMLSKN
jgi:hypothetical protein